MRKKSYFNVLVTGNDGFTPKVYITPQHLITVLTTKLQKRSSLESFEVRNVVVVLSLLNLA